MARSKKMCKFGFRISAIVFAIQFTVFIALFFFISSFVSSSSRKSAISNMQSSALDRSEIIREYVISAEDSLTHYLRAGQIYSLLKDPTNEAVVAEAQKYTETFSKDLRDLEGIYASKWDTTVLTHTAAPVVGMVTRDTDEKRKPLHDAMLATEGVYNAGILTSPASGQQIISVYKAVKDNDGTPIGLGGIGIFTNRLVDRLNETAIDGLPSAEYYLLNMDTGEYIFHPDPELIGTVAEGQYVSEIIGEAKNGGDDYCSSLQYRDESGVKRIAAFSKVSGYNWVFVIADASSEVLAPVIRITVILAIVFVVCLAILISTVYMVITKMVTPLKKVEEAVIYLEGFRLGHTADLGDITKKDDEIGHIADAVNKLCSSLNGVIEDMGRILSELARGNLTVDTDQNRGYYIGDFAAIRNNLGAIKGEMSGLLSKMHTASEKVYSGSGRVASISHTLSLGTPDQDGSIGGLVNNLGLIEHGIRDNAENCTAARSYMEKTSAAVAEVDERMEGLTKAMAEIADTSDQITNVVKTIEDIAFQTNILALNAAIEAARAGTEGKRFAVVADEVRKLAANSAEAVKDTTQLIESSVAAVKNGKDLTVKTAQSLEELGEYTNKVAKIVDDIAESGSKQAEMVGEINGGIAGISNVVESNSATAQESAAASEELSKQAGILKELIGRFKIDE